MFHGPKATPALSMLVQALGSPHPRAIARHLGVHERTVYAWQAQDNAPRAALLALFWETPWGRQWENAISVNDARAQAQLADSRRSTIERLERRVAYLERVGQFGSANAPTFTPAPFWPEDQVRFISSAATASANRLTS